MGGCLSGRDEENTGEEGGEGLKHVTCAKYTENHCCVSGCCFPLDFCMNQALYVLNGGHKDDSQTPNYNLGKKTCWGSVVGCVWPSVLKVLFCILGRPEIYAWDYVSEVHPRIDPKRTVNSINSLQELQDIAENGDIIQIGIQGTICGSDPTQAITKSNLMHVIVVIDEDWLQGDSKDIKEQMENKNGIFKSKNESKKIYQSTVNRILNGASGRKFDLAVNEYIYSGSPEGLYYAFLLKLSDDSRRTFNKNRSSVKEYLYEYTDIYCCNKSTNYPYSFSTLLRDYFVIFCLTCFKQEKKSPLILVYDSENNGFKYKKVEKKYIKFKERPTNSDVKRASYVNMKSHTYQYSACAKFQAGIHQAGGLIASDVNLSHVSNDSNCWPNYFKEYTKLILPIDKKVCDDPKRIGGLGDNPRLITYNEYIENFGKLDYDQYREAMNRYYLYPSEYLYHHEPSRILHFLENGFEGLEIVKKRKTDDNKEKTKPCRIFFLPRCIEFRSGHDVSQSINYSINLSPEKHTREEVSFSSEMSRDSKTRKTVETKYARYDFKFKDGSNKTNISIKIPENIHTTFEKFYQCFKYCPQVDIPTSYLGIFNGELGLITPTAEGLQIDGHKKLVLKYKYVVDYQIDSSNKNADRFVFTKIRNSIKEEVVIIHWSEIERLHQTKKVPKFSVLLKEKLQNHSKNGYVKTRKRLTRLSREGRNQQLQVEKKDIVINIDDVKKRIVEPKVLEVVEQKEVVDREDDDGESEYETETGTYVTGESEGEYEYETVTESEEEEEEPNKEKKE